MTRQYGTLREKQRDEDHQLTLPGNCETLREKQTETKI